MNSTRVPSGVPTGGQFSATTRDEAAVGLDADPLAYDPVPEWPLLEHDDGLSVDDWEVDLAQCGLHIGEWAEHGAFRVRFAHLATDPGGEPAMRSADGHGDESQPEGDTDGTVPIGLEIQVRESHPEAGEPEPRCPGWTTPRTLPASGSVIPGRYVGTGQARGRLAGFLLRQFDNTVGDLEAAWKDIGRLFDDAIPPIR